MLFQKEELAREVENTERNEYLKRYARSTNAKPGDKTPYETIFSNKVRYFDLSSHSVKEVLFKSRKNIAAKCFEASGSLFPNEEKIASCIKENSKEFTELEKKRETHFGNIFLKFRKEYDNCATLDSKCRTEKEHDLVWNAAKLPYFFAENNGL